MSTLTAPHTPFTTAEGEVHFFGVRGRRASNPLIWEINGKEVPAESLYPRICLLIAADLRSGARNHSTLLVGPRDAIVFYLEGSLRTEHLARAKIDPDTGEIVICGVEVALRTFTIRIAPNHKRSTR